MLSHFNLFLPKLRHDEREIRYRLAVVALRLRHEAPRSCNSFR
jgi:hypothetical protein